MVESCFFDIDTWVLSEVKTEIAVCPKLVVAGTLKIHVALVEESATAGTKLNPPLFEHKHFYRHVQPESRAHQEYLSIIHGNRWANLVQYYGFKK